MKAFFKKTFDALKNFAWGYVFIALVGAVLAILLFAFGHDALDYLAIAIGITVTVSSAVLFTLALSQRKRGFAFGIRVAFSVALLISGIATLIARESLIETIISVIGLLVIIDGSFKLNASALSKRYGSALWWMLLALSLVLIAGGYLTVRANGFDGKAGYILLGLLLITDSIASICNAFFAVFNEKRSASDLEERHPKENRENDIQVSRGNDGNEEH